MTRSSTEHYDLTELKKRDLIKLIRVHPWFLLLQAGEEFIDIFGNDTMTLVPVNVG